MSVVTELDRFIGKQERSIQHLQAKIERRAARGKPNAELEKALAGVHEGLARSRAQRAAVMEMCDAGVCFQIAVRALLLAALNDEGPAAIAFLQGSFEGANERFTRAAIACGAPSLEPGDGIQRRNTDLVPSEHATFGSMA